MLLPVSPTAFRSDTPRAGPHWFFGAVFLSTRAFVATLQPGVKRFQRISLAAHHQGPFALRFTLSSSGVSLADAERLGHQDRVLDAAPLG